jgi:hypothetical protein
MMDLIIETVKKLETMIKDSGCEDSGIVLDVIPHTVNCQFERGLCMTASFGGRSADFITREPISAKTKISFMYGAPLDSIPIRGAAAAIVNVVAGFFCISRILHSCPVSSHPDCQRQLLHEMGGKKIFCNGSIPAIETSFGSAVVTTPQEADVILMTGEGIIEPGAGSLLLTYNDTKRILFIGPSTAGIARMNELEHWCPFGTC